MPDMDYWIKKYESKTEPFSIPNGFSTFFNPDKGFFLYKAVGLILHIDATSTNDIKYMLREMNRIAKENGCKVYAAQTMRNPVAFMKLTGSNPCFDLAGTRANGKFYWVFARKVI